MRLSYINIQNFKCIDDWEFEVEDFSTIIGPNNTGKSSVLRAIEIFLNGDKPELNEWSRGNEDDPIVIQGIFDDINDWERNISGISSLIYDNKINLRAFIERDENEKISFHYEAYIGREDIEGWEESWGDLSEEIQDIANEIDIDGRGWPNVNKKERVRQRIREEHEDLILDVNYEWTDEGISIKPALKQGIPNCEIIPAVLDASEEGKSGYRKTILKKLIEKAVLPSIYESEEYQDILEAANRLAQRMKGDGTDQYEKVGQLANELTERVSSVIDANILLTMDSPDGEKIVNDNTLIKIDDGVETDIEYQGHGAQRALIFALIETLANQQSKEVNPDEEYDRPTILLFEEPELFIHPHLLRRFKDALDKLGAKDGWQVMAATHSPFIIDVSDNYKSLLITRKIEDEGSPEIFQLQENPFEDDGEVKERELLRGVLDFHPSVNEAFFAKRVVLVEGDTEISFFRYADKLLDLINLEPDLSRDTTIVSCSGKWTILPIARLLNAFEIPFRVIHDIDRKDKTDAELEDIAGNHPYKVNERVLEIIEDESVFQVDDTFEDILWPDGDYPSSDKPFNAWKRTREIIKDLNIDDFPELKSLVRFSFDW